MGSDANNAAQRGQEAHVEHAVRFVQHQRLDLAEVNQPALEVVFQPSRSRDDHACASADGFDLRPLGHSADHQRRLRQLAVTQLVVNVLDLHRQFARRDENQGPYAGYVFRSQLLHDGKQERQSFAGACLGCRQNVFAFQRMRDGHFLDRSGSCKVCCRQFLLEPSR